MKLMQFFEEQLLKSLHSLDFKRKVPAVTRKDD